jgi:hypothetical protein
MAPRRWFTRWAKDVSPLRSSAPLLLLLLLLLCTSSAAQIRFQGPSGTSGALTELPETTCTNMFLRALGTDGTGTCDPIAAADLPAAVLLSSGSYADPAWLTSLAYSKLTGTPTVVTSLTGTANQITASDSTGDLTLSLPQSIHSGASPTFSGLTLTGGSPGVGKVWTATDGTGLGSWQTPAGGGPGTGTANTLPLWATGTTLGDSNLLAESTDVYALRRGTTAQALKVYRTYTNATNYQMQLLGSDSLGNWGLISRGQGTGDNFALNLVTVNSGSIIFGLANAQRWQFEGQSDTYHLHPMTTNVYDVGTAALRVRTAYLGTSLDVAQGTVTTSSPAWTSTSTWNASGVTFTHLKANITDTASAAASKLLDLQVGAASKFSVDKTGALFIAGGSPGASKVLTSDASGNATWQTAGGGLPLSGTGATVTTSQPLLDLTQTWNDAGVTFTGLKSNITDTASAAASLLLDVQVGGASKFKVGKTGALTIATGAVTTTIPALDVAQTWNAANQFTAAKINVTNTNSSAGSRILDLQVGNNSAFLVTKEGLASIGSGLGTGGLELFQSLPITWASGGTADLGLVRTSAGLLEVNSGVAGTLRDIRARTHSSPQGTITTDIPALSTTATWNASGVTFTHLKANVTNTASAAASLLLDLQVGGASAFSVRKDGQVNHVGGLAGAPSIVFNNYTTTGWYPYAANYITAAVSGTAVLNIASTGLQLWGIELNFGSGAGSVDSTLLRDASNTLALRRTTNAQTFRTYGTWTDASNYVRASLGSSSTLVTLAAETAGSGADDVSINLAPAGAGVVQINGTPGVSGTCSSVTVVSGIVTACVP